jgi:hypothetical protein
MTRRLLNIFIISVVSLIIVSTAASMLVFATASSYNKTECPDKTDSAIQTNSTATASYTEMKVCVERIDYYKDNTLSGNPIGSKFFGEIVYAEQNSTGISRIYNKTGALLGYCESVALIDSSIKIFVELPYTWNSDGQVSKLVDLRKYILIFDVPLIYDEDEPIILQYDTMLRLFEAANAFYTELGYTLVLEKAYIPESKIPEATCCTTCSHATGASLTLKMLKIGSSKTEAIPRYSQDQIPNSSVSPFTKLLEDYALIRDEDSDCFYDTDYEAYMPTDHDLSSPIYSIWK